MHRNDEYKSSITVSCKLKHIDGVLNKVLESALRNEPLPEIWKIHQSLEFVEELREKYKCVVTPIDKEAEDE